MAVHSAEARYGRAILVGRSLLQEPAREVPAGQSLAVRRSCRAHERERRPLSARALRDRRRSRSQRSKPASWVSSCSDGRELGSPAVESWRSVSLWSRAAGDFRQSPAGWRPNFPRVSDLDGESLVAVIRAAPKVVGLYLLVWVVYGLAFWLAGRALFDVPLPSFRDTSGSSRSAGSSASSRSSRPAESACVKQSSSHC